MRSKKALVVLSGGQDSTTCLFWAKNVFEEVHAITFDYGQKHRVEIDSAKKVAELAKVVSHEVVNVRGLLKSRSPLTDPNAKLETYANYEEMDKIIGNRIELTFVPMRNSFFLTTAANYAIYFDCYDLVAGVCQMDSGNYPDCRELFIEKQEDAINCALGLPSGNRAMANAEVGSYSQNFRILTPLISLTKAETVKWSKTLPGCWEALAYSHTCYAGKTPPCIMTEKQACHACTLRQHGFEEAGYQDPLIERWQHELAHSTKF